MTRLLFITWITLSTFNAKAQNVLLECGQNSGQNFNGWYVAPQSALDAVTFDETATYFFSEFGGHFNLSMTKKVDALASVELFTLLFNFAVIDHAVIEHVVYYTSIDGKHWKPLNDSQNNVAITVENTEKNIEFIRAVAAVSMENNAKVACNYAKVEEKETQPLSDLYEPEAWEEELSSFYIFSYAHTLNIETAIESPYEVLITSISGQIVYRNEFMGSNRIELPFDLSGIYIVNIIHNNRFEANKKIQLE